MYHRSNFETTPLLPSQIALRDLFDQVALRSHPESSRVGAGMVNVDHAQLSKILTQEFLPCTIKDGTALRHAERMGWFARQLSEDPESLTFVNSTHITRSELDPAYGGASTPFGYIDKPPKGSWKINAGLSISTRQSGSRPHTGILRLYADSFQPRSAVWEFQNQPGMSKVLPSSEDELHPIEFIDEANALAAVEAIAKIFTRRG